MSQRSWKTDALLVIAHRGASAYAPENTMAAFKLAQAMGADGIEFDVKLTADGVPIVMHDATLDRTTNGSGEVARRTLLEIRELEAGSFFDDAFAGERVPTLVEVLEGLGTDLLFNIELTNYTSPRDNLPERCLQVVEEVGALERVLFSSFNPIAVWGLRGHVPDHQLGLLVGRSTPGIARWLMRRLVPHGALHPEVELLTKAIVSASHRRGKRVHAWTVNAPEIMEQLLLWGVDGLITDRPDVARDVIERGRNPDGRVDAG